VNYTFSTDHIIEPSSYVAEQYSSGVLGCIVLETLDISSTSKAGGKHSLEIAHDR
jgi:hypothetical protein